MKEEAQAQQARLIREMLLSRGRGRAGAQARASGGSDPPQ
jgi:hypothetical protein